MVPKPNRVAGVQRNETSRRRRWVRNAAFSAAILGLSALPHARRPPNVHFELVVHSGALHGKELYASIEERIKQEQVSVLTMESAGHTREENSKMERAFDQLRQKFNEWKIKERAPVLLQRAQAKVFARHATHDEFFQSILEASLMHDIPIRVAEEYSPAEGKRIRDMNAQHEALLEQGANEEDFEKCHTLITKAYQIYRSITPLRDPAIARTVRRLDQEYGKKGRIVAIFGEAHDKVPEKLDVTSTRPNARSQRFQNRQADIPQSLEQFSARIVLRVKLKQSMASSYPTEELLETAVQKWEPLLEKLTLPDFHRIATLCKGKKMAEKRVIIQRELQKLE